MKPTLLIALIGMISASILSTYIELDISLILCVAISLILIQIAFYFSDFNHSLSRKLSLLFSLFFIFSLINHAVIQNYQSAFPVEKTKDKIILGEIIQVKTNDDQFTTYHIKTDKIFHHDKWAYLNTKLIIICKSSNPIQCGNEVLLKPQLKKFENDFNPGAFDAQSYYLYHGYSGMSFLDESCLIDLGPATSLGSYFSRWQTYLSKQLDLQFPPREAGIAKALILGDKSSIDADLIQAFSNTGAMHVLAVSGLHVGILLYILQFFFSRFYRYISKRQALIIALLCIWAFTLLSGASPSVLRSTVMFTTLAFGQLIYIKSDPINSLILSAIMLLSYNPYFLSDIGFQLSYAALIGIFLFQKRIQNTFTFKHKWMDWTWNGTAVGIAATITTGPLMLYYFYQFPNYFLLSNISVMILGFALLLGLTVFLVLHKTPFINTLIAYITGIMIYLLITSIDLINKLPGSVSNGFHLSGWEVLLFYVLIGLWLYQKKNNIRYMRATALFLLLTAISFQRYQTLSQNQILLFNSQHFCAAIQYKGEAYFVYHPLISSKKLEQYINGFEHYYGTQISRKIALQAKNKLQLDDHLIELKLEKYTCLISVDKSKYHYFERFPNMTAQGVLFNTTLFRKFYGENPKQNVSIPL